MPFKKTIMMLLSISFLTLTACQGQGPKQSFGTIGGATAGGLLGSQIGKGKGRLLGVGIGVLLGSLIGSEIGRQLDENDRLQMQRANQRAYRAPLGEEITWYNPRSGNSGAIIPIRDGRSRSGDYCREFQQRITVGGQTQKAYGTACRQPDGQWKIIN